MANPPPVATGDERKNTQFHTVFVDTSLDTHIAMSVEEFDTVADFKKKIQREHVLCFPEIGEISVNVLQVKRRGLLYRLADSMYVTNAFEGAKSRWSVYVDACSSVKLGLENCVQGNGILHLERNVMEDRMDEQVNEADNFVRNVQKGELLNGKDDGDGVGDAVMKVIEDLEIDFEHMCDNHFRTSSCDTNKRVGTEVNRGNIPNGASDRFRKSGKKRKMDESENPTDGNSLKGIFSSGHENEAITASKRHKSKKKDKSSSKQSRTKTDKLIVDASVQGALNGGSDTIELLNITNSCVNKTAVGMLCDSDLDGHKALHAPTADGRLESENAQINVDLVTDQSHVSHLPTSSTPTKDHSDCEYVLYTGSTNEGSLMEKTTVDVPDPTAAPVSAVPVEKSKSSSKCKKKKKKTKAETLLNQLPSEVPVPAANNDTRISLQPTDSADKANLRILDTQNIQDALCEKKFSTSQSHLRQVPIGPTNVLSNGNVVLHPCSNNEDSSMAKTTVDGPDPTAASMSEVPTDRKSRNKRKKKKGKTTSETLLNRLPSEVPVPSENNDRRTGLQSTDSPDKDKLKDGHRNNKAKVVTEGVEAIQCDILCCQNVENIGLKSETANISHLGLGIGTDGGCVMDNVTGTDIPDLQVVKETEVNQAAPQIKVNSDRTNHGPAVENIQKLPKQKRNSATNPSGIQIQEKVVNPSHSTDDISCKDNSVGADKGVTEDAEKNNCKSSTSAGTSVPQVEGKNLNSAAGTNMLVDDSSKDNKLSSGTEEINFSDYFVLSQQNPKLVPSGDSGNANDEIIAPKDKSEDLEVKKISGAVGDGKISHVGSSQESLSMRQPHAAVLHSDTESFRVPKDRKPSTSTGRKQKLKSKDKKSKQISPEGATLDSPCASETQKSNPSHDMTKLNKTQFKVMSQHQSKDNSRGAANSNLKSPVGVQRTKSKNPASKKSSTFKANKAGNSANRRKTLLSTNIFKDDNNESSEDEEAVTSVHSTGTLFEDTHNSDVSEMEDDTGFATPITVGQRKAAEVENESSQNKYTLEKLRETARLEKAKRAEELGIPLEEFVPDSQAELELIE